MDNGFIMHCQGEDGQPLIWQGEGENNERFCGKGNARKLGRDFLARVDELKAVAE